MGHISIVYGNIIGTAWKVSDYHKLHRLNKQIIESLPSTDAHFPWIERNMFLVPDPDHCRMYRDQVIVFGASYKSVEQEWDIWLEKFEATLRKLYWTSATIHLETELVGSYTYEWGYDFNQWDNFMTEDPAPTLMWDFTGGPRRFYKDGSRIDSY